jgi:hypothetical protein
MALEKTPLLIQEGCPKGGVVTEGVYRVTYLPVDREGLLNWVTQKKQLVRSTYKFDRWVSARSYALASCCVMPITSSVNPGNA